MKKVSSRFATIFALVLAITIIPRVAGRAADQKVRPAGVAGSFYPADPKELTRTIDTLLAHNTVPHVPGSLVALVCPHASYAFTGPVAAACFSQLKGRKYTRVIVIAPSHFANFPFASVYDGDAYATPLGNVPVDLDFRAKLARLGDAVKASDEGHVRVGKFVEHSLEVELPWLQRTLGQFKLVPIIMGSQNYALDRAVGRALAKALLAESAESRAQTLILISSDLSHFHTYDYANNIDHQTLQGIKDWDYLSLAHNFAMVEHGVQTWEACGGGPIVAGMIAAEGLGAIHAQTLKYANSGDTTSDKFNVVGYGAVAIVPANVAADKRTTFTLTDSEKETLLKIAKASVESVVRSHKIYWVGPTGSPQLEAARGAFVTLTVHGQLRGCVGYTTPMKPLAKAVRDVAGDAAVEDSRFPPISARELPSLEYEISVMSPLHHVVDVNEIKIGQHGLIIKRADVEGLLLPQVPVEQHWDRDTFLKETCLKAGLPPQAWKDEATDIFSFTALIISEHSSHQSGQH